MGQGPLPKLLLPCLLSLPASCSGPAHGLPLLLCWGSAGWGSLSRALLGCLPSSTRGPSLLGQTSAPQPATLPVQVVAWEYKEGAFLGPRAGALQKLPSRSMQHAEGKRGVVRGEGMGEGRQEGRVNGVLDPGQQ